jgi:hypothetical protein
MGGILVGVAFADQARLGSQVSEYMGVILS